MKSFVSSFILLFVGSFCFAQPDVDSLNQLYQKFLELQESTEQLSNNLSNTKIDSLAYLKISTALENLNKQQKNLKEVLESNNKSIKKITKAQLFTNQVLLDRNKSRIINSTDFVESANVSLNTFNLTKEVFSYTNQITALNSPNNNDLGFSLIERINTILEERIFKGRSKVNKVKKSKFMQIVRGVLSAPITDKITSGIPVVGSIKSVVDLVLNLTIKGDDVEVKDLNLLKNSLKDYIEYYQGLELARKNFDTKINTITVRTEALQLLLRNYTKERIADLYPKVPEGQLKQSLNRLIEDYYNDKRVDYEIKQILEGHKSNNNTIAFEKALSDTRLLFPDFAVSQAKFIMDEIESISSIYEAALNSYQEEIEKVLQIGKSIGNKNKIELKIKSLRQSKEAVVNAIKASLNVKKVKYCYQSILGIV